MNNVLNKKLLVLRVHLDSNFVLFYVSKVANAKSDFKMVGIRGRAK